MKNFVDLKLHHIGIAVKDFEKLLEFYTLLEIKNAINRIKKISSSKITLMYGHQSLPTKPENAHMSYMSKLANQFKLPIGYQDHCDGDHESRFWLPAASLGMNISILEKHITHDRNKKGIDHESVLNPLEYFKNI